MNAILAIAAAPEAVVTQAPPVAGGADTFADALAGEMEAGSAPPPATATAGTGDSGGEGADEGGEDAPGGGNALPPWLPTPTPIATPPPTAGGESLVALAGATSPRAAVLAEAAPLLQASDALPATLPAATAVGAEAAADAAEAALLPNGKAFPAQAEPPSPAAPALANSTRFAATADAVQAPVASQPAQPLATATAAGVAAEAAGTAPTVDIARGVSNWAAAIERRTANATPATIAVLPNAAGASGVPSPETAGRVTPASLPPALAAALAPAAEAAPDPTLQASLLDAFAPPAAAPAPVAGAPSQPIAPAPAQLAPLPMPVGAPEWDIQLGDRVGVMVDQGLTNAQLKLSPAHLGPLEIRISLAEDKANVWFGTHSHATREALEAAAPRLRDLLGAQGYANVGVSVDLQQQAFRDPRGGTRYEPEFSFAAGATTPEPARVSGAASAARPVAGRPGIDAFA